MEKMPPFDQGSIRPLEDANLDRVAGGAQNAAEAGKKALGGKHRQKLSRFKICVSIAATIRKGDSLNGKANPFDLEDADIPEDADPDQLPK